MNTLLGGNITRNSLILGCFALVTVGILVLTEYLTRTPIEDARQRTLIAELQAVFPSHLHDNNLLDSTRTLEPHSLLANKAPVTAYIATQNNAISGYIIPATAPEGYGGAIELLVGVTAAGTITGVRVLLPHPETPGLGDGIEYKKSDWITGFNGKSLTNPTLAQWQVTKDGGVFDGFTGATITPRAVVNAVKNTLLYVREHMQHAQPHE